MNAVLWIIYIAVIVAMIAALWQVFTKAGEDGWKAIIPIWSTLVLLKIVGREWWWIILLLIPIVNIVVWIIVMIDLAKSFGRGTASRSDSSSCRSSSCSSWDSGAIRTKARPQVVSRPR